MSVAINAGRGNASRTIKTLAYHGACTYDRSADISDETNLQEHTVPAGETISPREAKSGVVML